MGVNEGSILKVASNSALLVTILAMAASILATSLTFALTSCKIRSMQIPRLSEKEALILRLLISRGEMYGLEMVKEAEGELKRGTVYVTLGRMAEKGYVESREIGMPDEEGPPRRAFRATGHGARVLNAWELADAAMAWGAP